MAQPVTKREAPPLLTNGSVCPVVGSRSQFTPMCTSAWQVIQNPIPKANNRPKAQLFYVNTLFTYMPCVRPTKVSFVKAMTDELLTYFPNFRANEYYKERTGAEEKKLIDMACDSALKFHVYYKLLWMYRNMMKKIRG